MKKSTNNVTAIVPALNEEANVGNVLTVLSDSKCFNEIILVDDGSTDRTAEIGKKFGVKVLSLKKIGGSGKGNAMEQGVKVASSDIVVFFDADLIGLTKKHIDLLIKPLLDKKVQMCVGVRGRLWGLPNMLAKIDPLTAIGGERAVAKELFLKLPEKLVQGFAVETALDYYCAAKKIKVKYVLLKNLDIVTKEEKEGFSKGFSDRIKMIGQIINIRLKIIFEKDKFL